MIHELFNLSHVSHGLVFLLDLLNSRLNLELRALLHGFQLQFWNKKKFPEHLMRGQCGMSKHSLQKPIGFGLNIAQDGSRWLYWYLER